MTPIEVKELCKVYSGKKRRKIEALKGVDLTVASGNVFGFLGPNGAGKSTLIKTLVGLIKPTSGSASLFGESTGSPGARKRIGYLPENPSFLDYLTAREYLRLVGSSFGMGKEQILTESNRVLETMGLVEAANRPIRGYSKGMVQRLGLAQTLLHNPDLYILDEPMSGLDPVGRALVKETMFELKKEGKTIFFSTHVIADVEAVCDRVAIIAGGQLRSVQDVEMILKSGIHGYSIHWRGGEHKSLAGLNPRRHGDGRFSIEVSKEMFQKTISAIFQGGGEIELVEPRRRSLETIFLDMVQKAT